MIVLEMCLSYRFALSTAMYTNSIHRNANCRKTGIKTGTTIRYHWMSEVMSCQHTTLGMILGEARLTVSKTTLFTVPSGSVRDSKHTKQNNNFFGLISQ